MTQGEKLSFFAPGIPVPGGSKRAFLMHQKGCPAGRRSNPGPCRCKPFTSVVEAAGQANKEWRTQVIRFAYEAAKELGGIMPCFSTVLKVDFTFYLPRPKHHYGKGGQLSPSAPQYPGTRPDVLKLARAVEDALTGIIWTDDCLIVDEHLLKEYATRIQGPGLFANVEPIEVAQKVLI